MLCLVPSAECSSHLGKRMRRRSFIAFAGIAAIGWPLSARGQQPPKIYRLGYLGSSRIPYSIAALQTGLRELGYIEGKNLKVEYRFGGQQPETLDTLASELVQLAPDAIIIVSTPAAIAAKRATTTIPIVMALVADPVRSGIVRTSPILAAISRASRCTGLSSAARRKPYQDSPASPFLTRGPTAAERP
jgi:hypothetical protein